MTAMHQTDYITRNRALEPRMVAKLAEAWKKYREAWRSTEQPEIDENLAALFSGWTVDDHREADIWMERRKVRHLIRALRAIRADEYASYRTYDDLYAAGAAETWRTPNHLAEIGRAIYGPEWQSPLAQRLGINRETIRRWLNGKTCLTPDHGLWRDLAKILNEETHTRQSDIGALSWLSYQLSRDR